MSRTKHYKWFFIIYGGEGSVFEGVASISLFMTGVGRTVDLQVWHPNLWPKLKVILNVLAIFYDWPKIFIQFCHCFIRSMHCNGLLSCVNFSSEILKGGIIFLLGCLSCEHTTIWTNEQPNNKEIPKIQDQHPIFIWDCKVLTPPGGCWAPISRREISN